MAQTVSMDMDAHLAAVELENHALLAAARSGALDAPVPACPGWDVHRLVAHIGGVHRWVIGWIETGKGGRPERGPDGEAILEWFASGVPVLLQHLRALDPDATTMSFVGEQPATFWPRRQAHEAAVHRCDVQSAHGEIAPIAAALAVDGVDELLEVFVVQRLGRDVVTGEGETIHLHATDIDGEWLIRLTPEGIDWTHGHAKGDVAARGRASDLVLALWNRLPLDALEIFGDAAVLERFRAGVAV